jgi:hypothetical protein
MREQPVMQISFFNVCDRTKARYRKAKLQNRRHAVDNTDYCRSLLSRARALVDNIDRIRKQTV